MNMSLICVHEFHLFLQERKHWLTSSNVQDENRNATERGKGRASKTTTFDYHWKSMEIWLATKHLVCCRGCNALVFIFKVYKTRYLLWSTVRLSVLQPICWLGKFLAALSVWALGTFIFTRARTTTEECKTVFISWI
jgi:hypothetical protein